MFPLFKKELRNFLNSLIGYLVIMVFLLSVSLFLFVFPGQFNILEMGAASIDPLFMLAPWVYLFLIPAITMRSFSEEKKSGTMELLLTRPLSEMQIILGKYFAGLVLVLVALAPTLVYYVSVHFLASPVGNIDLGAMWGSYLGLVFLAAGFVAIGIFASSITDSQIIAFIVGLFLCFIFYTGFDSISELALFGPVDLTIEQLGISAHYASMSRGVIDSRDVVYFLSLACFFLLLTRLVLRTAKWGTESKINSTESIHPNV